MTIAAVATGPAAGGVGIIRISGPNALEATREVVPSFVEKPTPRHAYFARFEEQDGSALDEGVVIYFQAPNSFTGEDVVELQVHGSPRLLQMLLRRVVEVPSVRMAEPGEFTRRAYLNGRIDLIKAEAVSQLISAETENAVRSSAVQLMGGLSERVKHIREPLLQLYADLEASLDFPDEAEGADDGVSDRIAPLLHEIRELVATGKKGNLLRRGARIVLYGPANAGKSTLFNRWVGESRALVDDEPGTTRDVLEARLELRGLALTLVDTAGLRESPGRIESLGIEKTKEALASADVAILIVPPDASEGSVAEWSHLVDEVRRIDAFGKADVRVNSPLRQLSVSGKTGQGFLELQDEVFARLGTGTLEGILVTSERQWNMLKRAELHLSQAQVALSASTLEVVSGEVGLAVDALGQVLGVATTPDMLDEVFARFCIGK